MKMFKFFLAVYSVRKEYSEPAEQKPKKMADLGPRKFEGIGPTTKDGMPIVLRSVSCSNIYLCKVGIQVYGSCNSIHVTKYINKMQV